MLTEDTGASLIHSCIDYINSYSWLHQHQETDSSVQNSVAMVKNEVDPLYMDKVGNQNFHESKFREAITTYFLAMETPIDWS